jgi:adenine-specific DNA-methyltransferase
MLALQELDMVRQERIAAVKPSHKAQFAQYLTPLEIARYMADLTLRYMENDALEGNTPCSILDPGAGSGILSSCLVSALAHTGRPISLEAWELDTTILETLDLAYHRLGVPYTINRKDFITQMGPDILWDINKKYDLIIMNPPYKKINTNTVYRSALHDIGIETGNTYSAFMAIAVKLLADKGILTAIVPRSFCNGLYFLPFRKFLAEHAVIRHLHSFEKRDNAFGDEHVLQENIIITLQKTTKKHKTVTISHAQDRAFSAYTEFTVPYDVVINSADQQLYISIPQKKKPVLLSLPSCNTDLSFDISTGPIVDFRFREKLIYGEVETGIGMPLLYAVHIRNQKITWPAESKKPNAIILDEDELEKNTFKKGYYILVKRFSSKEEKRRICATLVTPNSLPTKYFTVENHLNIIHHNHGSLDKDIAIGLTAFLNTAYCDTLFREFSGHTQVNATDLRNMRYPSADVLIKLGSLVQGRPLEEYDTLFSALVVNNAQ